MCHLALFLGANRSLGERYRPNSGVLSNSIRCVRLRSPSWSTRHTSCHSFVLQLWSASVTQGEGQHELYSSLWWPLHVFCIRRKGFPKFDDLIWYSPNDSEVHTEVAYESTEVLIHSISIDSFHLSQVAMERSMRGPSSSAAVQGSSVVAPFRVSVVSGLRGSASRLGLGPSTEYTFVVFVNPVTRVGEVQRKKKRCLK